MRISTYSLVALLISFFTMSGHIQAASGDPCQSDGTLKGWATKEGYTVEDCSAPTSTTSTGTSDSTTTSGGDRDPCGQDGSLKGWARKAGYSADSCQSTTDTTPTTENTAPTITILSPSEGYTAGSGTTITFTASASDTEDGDLSSSVSWSSSLDGAISSSTSLSAGSHLITSVVTDSNGASASAQINIEITEVVATTEPVEKLLTLNWQAPTQREDGSSLAVSEIAGYEIYMVADSGTENIIAINEGTTVNHAMYVPTGDIYHFAISAIDTSGSQSALSGTVSATVD